MFAINRFANIHVRTVIQYRVDLRDYLDLHKKALPLPPATTMHVHTSCHLIANVLFFYESAVDLRHEMKISITAKH